MKAGTSNVVVISYGLWQRAFASDPKIIGRQVVLALRSYTVVGVMRRLSAGEPSVEKVAASVGFKGADSFRRAFERRFRITPGKYRRRFGFSPRHSPNESSTRRQRRRKIS